MLANVLLLGAALSSLASAATVKVLVGSGGLKFVPNDIKAAVGDSIEFQFGATLHSVSQSTAAEPCAYLDGGFFSTTQVKTANFVINVTDTAPMYFYCSVPTHCAQGMVGIINA
jgi:plastocyanin